MELNGRYAPLPRRIIECSGDDAASFLQGLVSNNTARLPAYAALLTPQGKFLHDFFLLPGKNSILIDCAETSLPDLLARLTIYKLRSKVTIEAKENVGVFAVWNTKDSGFLTFPDPRSAQLGWRMVGDVAAIKSWCAGQNFGIADYERARLELGIPDGAQDMTFEKSLLLEFGFEDLHGVDFKKGCYVGQEVTARSKYRGQVRKFIYQVRVVHGTLPACGTAVTQDGTAVGELRSNQNGIGLALLNVAAVEKALAEHKNFQAGSAALTAALPAWVMHPPKALTVAE
jgi:folate-binding protein YgfZ